MSDYGHYVSYRQSTDQVCDRVAHPRPTAIPGERRHPARRALARRLHTLADRLDG